MVLSILALIILYGFYHSSKLVRQSRRELEAFDLHCDMYSKYRELAEDPLLSNLKWKEWLPIFEAADKKCEALDPEMVARIGRVSDFVKRIINDDGYKQDLEAAR